MKEVCRTPERHQDDDPKGWKTRNRAGEPQCPGPRQLLLGSSSYSHGLGSVRAGHIYSHRTGNRSDSLLEAEAQEERTESDTGSEGEGMFLSE